MIILRDFPSDSALFGLVILITPVFWSKGPGYPKDPDISQTWVSSTFLGETAFRDARQETLLAHRSLLSSYLNDMGECTTEAVIGYLNHIMMILLP